MLNLIVFLSAVRAVLVFASLTLAADAVAGQQRFAANLSNLQTVPMSASTANGVCRATLSAAETGLTLECTYAGIAPDSSFNIHRDASVGQTSSPLQSFPLPNGSTGFGTTIASSESFGGSLRENRWYIQITSPAYPNVEIRGQIKLANGT